LTGCLLRKIEGKFTLFAFAYIRDRLFNTENNAGNIIVIFKKKSNKYQRKIFLVMQTL
jgi:hypothetical protein